MVKTYVPMIMDCAGPAFAGFREDPDGDMVRIEDYEKLLDAYNKATSLIDNSVALVKAGSLWREFEYSRRQLRKELIVY